VTSATIKIWAIWDAAATNTTLNHSPRVSGRGSTGSGMASNGVPASRSSSVSLVALDESVGRTRSSRPVTTNATVTSVRKAMTSQIRVRVISVAIAQT
jgi:hypothetical protein